jgi:CheY-like chemotaxis protein
MILVVDDCAATRALIAATVAPLGREILEAGDGAEALRMFGQHRISLVITDDRMPVMSGGELVQAIRATDTMVGIVMVTAFSTPTHPLDWSGCNAIFRKPFDAGALLAVAESRMPPLVPATALGGPSRHRSKEH